MKDILENVETIIKKRGSSKSINIEKSINIVKEIIKKSYSVSENKVYSVPSAGGLYGLKINLYYKDFCTSFAINGIEKEQSFDFSVLKDTFFQKNSNFSEHSFLIAIYYDYNLYYQKYGNCGVRYAAIECGAFLQNLQLMLLEHGIKGCPIGSFDDRVLKLDELLLYFLIN